MPNFSLQDRTAFVTGAARGLGRAIAEALLDEECAVAMADIDDGVVPAAEALARSGRRVLPLRLDVRDEASFRRAFAEAVQAFGHIEIMVNNAARTVVRSVWEIDADEWDDVLRVNLRGAFFGCRIAGEHMRGRRVGRIINMSSIAGQQGSAATGAHYACSKAAILALTKIFAHELAPHGVTVNALAPSAIEGPMLASLPAEAIAGLQRTVPLGRLGRPDDVTAAVIYLCSDASSFVTGATLDVNGGRFMR
jgi:3-oxoacyl-[acyl-carrier protein] reductase